MMKMENRVRWCDVSSGLSIIYYKQQDLKGLWEIV